MSKKITAALLLIAAMGACKKDLSDPVQGYFFIQQTPSENHSLYINGNLIGPLENITFIPSLCVDSTLDKTTAHVLTKKKNHYELKNSRNEVVAEGFFKFRKNGFQNSANKDIGVTYFNQSENEIIVGFNTDENILGFFRQNDPCREPPVN